jgi:hypothetical protein
VKLNDRRGNNMDVIESEFDYEIINSRMKPVADELVSKYEEISHIRTDSILFIVNYRTGGGKKKVVLARTRVIPAKWSAFSFSSGPVRTPT